jgi:thymidylate synthase (FAD)
MNNIVDHVNVLDYGFIKLKDYMGDDVMVVNAARVSFSKSVDTVSDKDEKLIQYLAKNGHWTPFAHPQIQLHIKMPIFVARQWYRTTVGVARNEVSRRYVSSVPEIHMPKDWRQIGENKKQGSLDEPVEKSEYFGIRVQEFYKQCLSLYSELLDSGVCPEQAREVLPQGMYTEFIETGSLYTYARIYGTRNKSTEAQKEIQVYAEAMGDIARSLFPISWAALTEAK